MKLFVVVCENPNPRIEAAIRQHFPKHHLVLAFNAWLVGGDTTAQELSRTLGIYDGSNGAGLVIGVASYYGRASKRTRDWISQRFSLDDRPAHQDGDEAAAAADQPERSRGGGLG
ncbi:MAG: hypothetical protein KDA49_05560 [Rhodospirillaceae bacterium]|nr:hypothetical protein [Rhodospirillaceae bacterium]MCA8931912.1 hypothetical protein [Rhodospirillaceae bacterium]